MTSTPANGGFPDNGNGWYADKLPYATWYTLNNANRVHQNFVESLPQILIFLLISGLYFPDAALAVGVINCIARPVYIYSYMKGGPNARILGAVGGGAPLYTLGMVTMGKICMDYIM